MAGLLLASPEEEALSFLAGLGIALPLHCKRQERNVARVTKLKKTIGELTHARFKL
jgi:hypothetical protein